MLIPWEKISGSGHTGYALLNVPGIPSKFIYVDLVDKRDSLVNRVKLVIRDSCFYGQLPLSKSLQQGEYCLRAYTYNMQNQDKDWVFRKKIRVINPMDSRVWTEVSIRRKRKLLCCSPVLGWK
ncbi:MAG: hypothetical protein ACLU4N_15905 [Butyricimonas faecihominis]